MENAVAEKNPNPVSVREIGTITAEIKDITCQAKQVMLWAAIEIGRRLEESKSILPHGKWREWFDKSEFDFSHSSAINFMRLYHEYGDMNITPFGLTSNSQTFVNLTYSKALQLLAVPKEEREEVANELDAENLSVRELKAAIEERDRARKEAEEAKLRESELAEKLKQAESASETVKRKEKEIADLAFRLKNVKSNFEAEKKRAFEASKKLEEAKKNPNIPKDFLAKLQKEAKEVAEKELSVKSSEELTKATEALNKALKEADVAKLAEKEAISRFEEAQKKLKTANPEVSAFKVLFDQMQGMAAKLKEMLEEIKKNDPETADKLVSALKAFGTTL